MSEELRLAAPSAAMLPGYAAALERGWSPNTTRDVSFEQLAELNRDAAAFLHDLTDENGTVLQPDGIRLPRIPFRVFWLSDGEFCGAINLRFVPGTEALPAHVSGYVGYAVVPWKRRRGYASRALALILPVAREVGLSRIEITCDEENEPSRRVIEKNGGILTGTRPERGGHRKLVFRIDLVTRA